MMSQNRINHKNTIKSQHIITVMRPSIVDEVRRLFAVYRSYTGVEPMAGGAQNLIRLAADAYEPVELFDPPAIKGRRKVKLDTLPIGIQMQILEYLSADDLCNMALVNRRCYIASSDYRLWRRTLVRDLHTWTRINDDRNPDAFSQACMDMSFKEIYLRCDPSRHPLTPQLDNPHTRTAVRYTNNLMNFVGQSRTRFVMFGPGLETRSGKIVRHILTDEHMHDLRTPATTGPFKVTGMMPGETAGMGAGIRLRLADQYFTLITLYSNTKSVRQRLSAENRVQQNKLFVLDQRDNADGAQPMVELNPQTRQLCSKANAFVYIIDANNTIDEVASYEAEMQAMLCNLWSPNESPVLVLVCRTSDSDTSTSKQATLSPIDVVRALRMGRVKRKWMVASGDVHSLSGIREAFYWLATNSNPVNAFFS